jgi:hypothetical protein
MSMGAGLAEEGRGHTASDRDDEDLILNGPWVGEDGRVRTMKVSTLYEAQIITGIYQPMPFNVDEDRYTLDYTVWRLHGDDHDHTADLGIGKSGEALFRVSADMLIVGETVFFATDFVAADFVATEFVASDRTRRKVGLKSDSDQVTA